MLLSYPDDWLFGVDTVGFICFSLVRMDTITVMVVITAVYLFHGFLIELIFFVEVGCIMKLNS